MLSDSGTVLVWKAGVGHCGDLVSNFDLQNVQGTRNRGNKDVQ